jgi:CheY-like chemotaxis protein
VATQRVILVHDEEEVLDLLRGLFEAHDYTVETHGSVDGAFERIATATISVVITAWDRAIGQAVYQRVLGAHRELRHRFVFVADEITERTAPAAAHGRLVRLGDLNGLLVATRARFARLAEKIARKRVLLVEDDPEQLAAIREILIEEGFDVQAAPSGRAATDLLQHASFDAVLSDWQMEDGSGSDLFEWMKANRNDLLRALVFLTGGDLVAVRSRVNGCAVLPKGQDSPPLLELLRR